MGDYNDDNGVKYVSNRVLYVEPNYNESVPMQGPRGLHSYEFENPLEDYCIYVSLSVEVRGRVIRTDYVSNKKEMGLTYVIQQGQLLSRKQISRRRAQCVQERRLFSHHRL